MKILFPLFLFPVLFAVNVLAQTRDFKTLSLDLSHRIVSSGAESVGVAVLDLNSGGRIAIDENKTFHAASTMKVPVMMRLFKLAAEKKLKLTDKVKIENSFKSIVDGSLYQLDAGADGDPDLYKMVGSQMTVRDLIEHMITRSSNLATNLLIDKADAREVTALMRSLGARDIQIRRGVEDNKAFQAGLNNTTTAGDLMIALKAIVEGKFIGRKFSDEMITILARQHFNEGIPAGLPSGVKVAHKTGSITKIYHDAGIVFPPGRKPYVIVVLTRGFAKEEDAHKLVGEVSRMVYEVIGTKAPK